MVIIRHVRIPAIMAAILLFTGISAAQKSVKVPHGNAAVVDGTIGTTEWSDAATFDLVGGGRILLKHDGTFVFVGVQASAKGWCHLYVDRGSGIEVLHASAALGRIVFTRDKNGNWQTRDTFDWELRDRVVNTETKTKMDQYLAQNAWVASNSNMGEPIDMEFKVKLGEGRITIAGLHTTDGKTMHFFPKELSDDTLKSELVRGGGWSSVSFNTSLWARLEIQGIKSK